jgi:hypothetical protein
MDNRPHAVTINPSPSENGHDAYLISLHYFCRASPSRGTLVYVQNEPVDGHFLVRALSTSLNKLVVAGEVIGVCDDPSLLPSQTYEHAKMFAARAAEGVFPSGGKACVVDRSTPEELNYHFNKGDLSE